MKNDNNRKNFLDSIKVVKVPVVKSNDINYDFVDSVSQKQKRKKQQQRYTAQKGTRQNAKEKGISQKARLRVAALALAGTLAVSGIALMATGFAKNEKPSIQTINITEEYERLGDITEKLQNAKQHYDLGLNAEGEPITEENMNEELKNIQELIKSAYKLKIGEACGVKPEDANKITGKEERILNVDDKHMHVVIPEEISPTGERIDLWDDEIPIEIVSMIRAAGSINDYNNSNIEWGRALNYLEIAILNSEGKYIFDKENNKLISVSTKNVEIIKDDGEER